MANNIEQTQTQTSPFLSPTEAIKQRSVSLMFSCIDLDGNSHEDESKYAFCRKTKSLSILLERYTPKKIRAETRQWYDQLKGEEKSIKENDRFTPAEKTSAVLEKRYAYSIEVHEQNIKILMKSPIIEIEAEGELDITDDEAIQVIRGGKRNDAGELIY